MADFEALDKAEPTTISGYRAPEDQVAERVVVDMENTILRYMPEAQPFLTLTGRIKGKMKTHNVKKEWLEKDFKPRRVTISGAQTDIDTTVELVTGDGSKVGANDVLKNLRTGEIFFSSTTPAADALTVVRGVGAAPAAMNDGDNAIIIGSSFPDNSQMGAMKSITEYPNFNYSQIFRTGFGFSGRDIATEFYGGDDVDNETKWQAVEHKRSIEYSFLFGKRELIAAAGGVKQRTFTGGLEQSIVSNVWNVGGEPTERAWIEMLEEALRWGKGGRLQGGAALKYALMSSRWLTIINAFALNKLQYRVLDEEIGFGVMEYVSPHGRIRLVPTPLLDEYHPDYAFIVDMNHVDYFYLRGRDTKLLSGREENDRDGEAYEYFSDCGLKTEFEQSHTLLKGVPV